VAIVQARCPHCLTEKAPLNTVNQHAACVNPARGVSFLLMQCGVCREGILAVVGTPDLSPWLVHNAPIPLPVVRYYPEVVDPVAPDHVPNSIGRYFLQGVDNAKRSNFDAAGMMFRKSLDIAIKDLNPDAKGSLFSRINSIPDAVGVTPALKAWAHEIRELGNDAAHEEEPFTDSQVVQWDCQEFRVWGLVH
jgi:hypothetical protein